MLAVVLAIVLDGVTLTGSVAPQLVDGRIFVPWSAFVVRVARKGSYDDRTGTIALDGPEHRLIMRVGSRTATLDERPIALPSSSYIGRDDLYVPLAAIAPALGIRIRYDARAKEVDVETNAAGELTSPTPYAKPQETMKPRALFTPEPIVTPRVMLGATPRPRRTPIPIDEIPPR